MIPVSVSELKSHILYYVKYEKDNQVLYKKLYYCSFQTNMNFEMEEGEETEERNTYVFCNIKPGTKSWESYKSSEFQVFLPEKDKIIENALKRSLFSQELNKGTNTDIGNFLKYTFF
jgi:hypothetical protein